MRRAVAGLISLFALAVPAAAQADPFAVTATSAFINAGSNQNLQALKPPDTATLSGTIDPASGNFSIPAGQLLPPKTVQVPNPLGGMINVKITLSTSQATTGNYNSATGALTASVTASAAIDIPSYSAHCVGTTTPSTVPFSTANNLGSHLGDPFDDPEGLEGDGAIAGSWTDLSLSPKDAGSTFYCNIAAGQVGGAGGAWIGRDADAPTDPGEPDPGVPDPGTGPGGGQGGQAPGGASPGPSIKPRRKCPRKKKLKRGRCVKKKKKPRRR